MVGLTCTAWGEYVAFFAGGVKEQKRGSEEFPDLVTFYIFWRRLRLWKPCRIRWWGSRESQLRHAWHALFATSSSEMPPLFPNAFIRVSLYPSPTLLLSHLRQIFSFQFWIRFSNLQFLMIYLFYPCLWIWLWRSGPSLKSSCYTHSSNIPDLFDDCRDWWN